MKDRKSAAAVTAEETEAAATVKTSFGGRKIRGAAKAGFFFSHSRARRSRREYVNVSCAVLCTTVGPGV